MVPSLAIAVGTQIGERYASRLSARSRLIAGMLAGAAGTAIMVAGAWPESSYAVIVPGLVVSGIGQGIVWTAMWIIASSGVSDSEQGVASGMASTTMNIGNAVGLAVLVGFANAHAGFAKGEVSAGDLASGVRLAFWLCATGGVIATVIAMAVLVPPRQLR
ncbi:MFS transporter [Rhizobium sp. P28RR-XV]|uniref:MFS transporter n=1 Tax=Rhizobium sp. P28RR-XV TaxID=2726737 RepID=UPI001FEFC383